MRRLRAPLEKTIALIRPCQKSDEQMPSIYEFVRQPSHMTVRLEATSQLPMVAHECLLRRKKQSMASTT